MSNVCIPLQVLLDVTYNISRMYRWTRTFSVTLYRVILSPGRYARGYVVKKGDTHTHALLYLT